MLDLRSHFLYIESWISVQCCLLQAGSSVSVCGSAGFTQSVLILTEMSHNKKPTSVCALSCRLQGIVTNR